MKKITLKFYADDIYQIEKALTNDAIRLKRIKEIDIRDRLAYQADKYMNLAKLIKAEREKQTKN